MNAPQHEASTTMFVRLHGRRQWLGYALRADITEEISVAIPLPVAAGTSVADIELRSLEEYPEFFSLIQKPFPRGRVDRLQTRGAGGGVSEALPVVYLGDYAASVAVQPSELARVDPALALRPRALERLPQYATYAFVVLRLKPPRRVVIDPRGLRKAIEHHAILIDFPTALPRCPFLSYPRGAQRRIASNGALRSLALLPSDIESATGGRMAALRTAAWSLRLREHSAGR
ncbi:MAG: hypothetical protein HOW73_24210 [Polyangiaceae bacterium]|nr:hypothetical protein [Polyangiaceae bacterium]